MNVNFVFLSEYIQAYVVQLLVHVSQKFLVRILVLRALRPFRSQVISAFLRFPPLCIRIYPSAAGDSQVSFARDELEIAAEGGGGTILGGPTIEAPYKHNRYCARPRKICYVLKHPTADLRCIQCHVNPMTLHGQNQNNPLVHLFVGRGRSW